MVGEVEDRLVEGSEEDNPLARVREVPVELSRDVDSRRAVAQRECREALDDDDEPAGSERARRGRKGEADAFPELEPGEVERLRAGVHEFEELSRPRCRDCWARSRAGGT